MEAAAPAPWRVMARVPDVTMFASGSIYDAVPDDSTWVTLSTLQNGTYYEIPIEPYNWLGRPLGRTG